MFFSILIPVYNVEKYIHECVDSVLSQDEQDYEIILVDDGSTDTSGAICDAYALKYPEKVRVIHKQNEGLLLTRRRAIREARGDWFVHLDSDDYMMPGAMKKIRQVITENNADLIISNFIYGQENIVDMSHKANLPFEALEVFEEGEKHRILMQFLYGGSITAIWQKIANKTVVDKESDYSSVGFVSMMEDHLQSMPLLDRAKKIVYVNIPLVYYRYNVNSITKENNFDAKIKCYRSIREVYAAEASYRTKWGISKEENGLILAKHFRRLSYYLKEIAKNKTEKSNLILYEIANDQSLKKEFRQADKKIMGKESWLLFSLAFQRRNKLLRFACMSKITGL